VKTKRNWRFKRESIPVFVLSLFLRK
jgi:hypothetical protein